MGDDVEMGVEPQGEQAPGLSEVDVAELKSFPCATQQKVTTESKGSSIMNTASVCPVTGICYDFSELEDRNRAVSRLCSEKPHVLITSQLHSSSSKPVSLNVRSRGTSEREQVTRRAREHLEFMCKLIMIQHRNKRYFIHEHPDDTHLWHNQCVQEVLSVTQATVTKFDRCQFGSLNADNIGLKKSHGIRSRFISTMPAIDAVFGSKHVMRKPARLSCRKPFCQPLNCRGNGTSVESNCWLPLRQRVKHQQEVQTYRKRSRRMKFWRPGMMQVEKILTQPLYWRPDEKKLHTTKR